MTITGTKWVYRFNEGDATMRDLLGGKGAGLCEMSRLGLPVPPGFIITTEACREYFRRDRSFPEGLWEDVLEKLRELEAATGRRLGDPSAPLLVSVRSGAKFSMPGMMDTILNLGLNDETAAGLARMTGNERFALDAFRRFIQLFGKVVLHVEGGKFERLLDEAKESAGARTDAELGAGELTALVKRFRRLVREETGEEFPGDPFVQLQHAIRAVFESWNSRRAIDYRSFHNIPHDLGTAVNIVSMVFGNLGEDSGTGVLFTRNPADGRLEIYGEYLANAQGEDVVAGIRTPKKIAQLAEEMPAVYQELEQFARNLERHYRDAQDIEFTIERSRLFVLQTRAAKRTAAAAVRMAVEMAKEGLIDRETALQRVVADEIAQLLLPRFSQESRERAMRDGRLLGRGLNASPGAATGKAVFDADRAVRLSESGDAIILVRPETNPDDVHGILTARGVLTSRGGLTSHAAVVTRGLGKACIVGLEAMKVDLERRQMVLNGTTIREDDQLSIDGTSGEVFVGAIATTQADLRENAYLLELLGWADGVRRLGVLANADYPKDAAQALAYGAEGIGLCRTEHMFFETDRLPFVRQMLIHAPEAARLNGLLMAARRALEMGEGDVARLQHAVEEAETAIRESETVWNYRDALARLEEFQAADFTGILEVMQGKPVVIRLLDMPLHEFLPNRDELLGEIASLETAGENPGLMAERREELRLVDSLREANPMLGHRGCRLGISFPEIYDMQVRAIISAAGNLVKRGIDARPEIMIPLVSHVNELKILKPRLQHVAEEAEARVGVAVHRRFGTMIELPRAALTAGEIAQYAEFFSFGSNDLTQMTFGYSRDDAEGKFLREYVERDILPFNPFKSIDRPGVGRLIRLAAEEGRATRSDLILGICGEHGGDPESIAFCEMAGLTYVSCSPFRIPVARLAAAQTVLGRRERDR